MGDFVSVIPVSTLNSLLGDVSAWMTGTILPGLDEHIIANMANSPASIAFLNRMLPHLDTVQLASVVNTNWAWVDSLVTNITSATISNMLGGLTPWITGTLIPGLDNPIDRGRIAASPTTRPPSPSSTTCCRASRRFRAGRHRQRQRAVDRRLHLGHHRGDRQRPAHPARGPWINNTLNDAGVSTTIAGIANDPATINFINALLPQLNAASLAGIVNGNYAWLDSVVTGRHPGHRQQHARRADPLDHRHPHPRPGQPHRPTIAGIANDPATIAFINAPAAEPQRVRAGRHRQRQRAVDRRLSPRASPWRPSATCSPGSRPTTGSITLMNDAGVRTTIAGIANDPATINFINALLPQLNAASMASIVNTNWGWLGLGGHQRRPGHHKQHARRPDPLDHRHPHARPGQPHQPSPASPTTRPPSPSSTTCCRASTRPRWPASSTATGQLDRRLHPGITGDRQRHDHPAQATLDQ